MPGCPPGAGGAVNVTLVAFALMVRCEMVAPATCNTPAAWNVLPVSVTVTPPATSTAFGAMALIVAATPVGGGGGAVLYVSAVDALWPSGFVQTTVCKPAARFGAANDTDVAVRLPTATLLPL